MTLLLRRSSLFVPAANERLLALEERDQQASGRDHPRPGGTHPSQKEVARAALAESGELWVGFFAPARVPKPIIQRLVAEIEKASEAPDVLGKFKGLGVQRLPGSPDVLAKMLKDDLVTWGPIVKASGANVD